MKSVTIEKKNKSKYPKKPLEQEINVIIDEKGDLPVIYHMADIHVMNNNGRYVEFEEVFEKVYKILENEKREKIIIIAGDLFDNKTAMASYELTFVSIFISNLVKYGELILIDGNHDMNMTNEKVESTILGMLTLPKRLNINGIERIHYLNENKMYKIKGINFVLTTMFTKEVTKIAKKNPEEIYIGLYHGKVYGAKTDLDYKINKSNSYFRTTDFKDYDIVCLGDIHKHQFLDEKKRIAYPSSLIQKHFGETVKNHGLILWDLKKLEGKFIPIHNDYCMINCKLEKKELVIDEELDLDEYKYIKAKMTYKRDEIKNPDIFEKRLRKKYNFKEITMYEEITIKNDETMDGKIDDDIKKVFDEYIEKSDNKEEEKNEMKKMVYEIIDKNDLDIERNMKKIELNSLCFSNLFCYGMGNIIKFDKLNKIVGIVADNGWGKSSIIDALLYTIYQRSARTKKGTQVLNKFKDNSSSTLHFKINDTPYKINREIRSLKTKNDEILTISKNGVNITCDKKTNTSKMIEDIFGTYEEMTDNNIILQNSNNFINKTDKEKKEVMYKIFGIEAYDMIYQCINNKMSNLKTQIKLEEKKLLSLDEEKKINDDIKKNLIELEIINNEYKNVYDIVITQNHYNIELKKITGNQTDINKVINDNESCISEINTNNDLIIEYSNEFENNDIILSEKIIDIIYEILELSRIKLDKLQNEITQEKLKKKNITPINNIDTKIKILEKNNMNIRELHDELKLLNSKDNEKNIDDIKSELTKLKLFLIDYESSKKMLDDQKIKNKNLLEHKFNEKCEDCDHNKKIHEKINYIGKINELTEFIVKNVNIKDDINNLESLLNTKQSIVDIENKIKVLKKENININELIALDNLNKEYEVNNKEIDIIVNKKEKKYITMNDDYKEKLKKFNKIKTLINSKKKLEDKKLSLEKIIENWKNNETEINHLKELLIDFDENLEKKKKI